MDVNYLMLMANPQKIKRDNTGIIHTDYLYTYIKSRFKSYNENIIKEIYDSIKIHINDIDLIELEIKYIIRDLINLAIYNSINCEYI